MIDFSAEGYTFEFDPNSGTAGELEAYNEERGEGESFGAKIDLSSLQSRTRWAKAASASYPDAFADGAGLERALGELYKYAKERQRITEEKTAAESDDEAILAAAAEGTAAFEHAMEILQSNDILERWAADMFKLGHVGEWMNKKLACVAIVSARAGVPVQPSTHAQSSAGKNALWDTATRLLPPELLIKRSGITAKALFRTNESLRHRVLYIQEREGSETAEYSLRVLQSDGGLEYESTEKEPDGTLTTKVHKKEGPCVVIQTTTRNHLHPENETRVVPIYIDESEEQTARINEEKKRRAANKGRISAEQEKEICEPWHEALRLLQPAPVVVPYAERINVPTAPVRIRRDLPQLINITSIVAWLHQYQRAKDEEGNTLATEADFEIALELVGSSFVRAWQSLSPSEEHALAACRALPKNRRTAGFKKGDAEKKMRELGTYTSHSSLRDALAGLVTSGHLDVDSRRGPQGNTYTLPDRVDVTKTIFLEALPVHSSINHESPANDGKIIDECENVHYRQSSINEDEGDANGLMDGNGRNADPSIKSDDLQEKRVNGRMDGEDDESSASFEYSEDEGEDENADKEQQE